MAKARSTYKSYLLRLWREDVAGAPWRACLERIAHGGERHHFPDLDSLIAFLLAELGPGRSLPGSGGQVDEAG
jgi:hypothetical protein